MLNIGSIIYAFDNSGARSVQLLNIKCKRRYACVSSLAYGVVKTAAPLRPLTAKKFVTILIVNTKKKKLRGNGMFVNFSSNVGVPLKITKFTVPAASSVYCSIPFEITYLQQFKVIVQSVQYVR